MKMALGIAIGYLFTRLVEWLLSLTPDEYDQEETVENCTVHILMNSETGKSSVGWWQGKKDAMYYTTKDGDEFEFTPEADDGKETK